MPNIVLIIKKTREQVMIQPESYQQLFMLLKKHNLTTFNQYLDQGKWVDKAYNWFDKINKGVIVTSRDLHCHMYLAPENIKPIEEEVATCPSCGQELPDEN